jgi:hypothetical protein
MERKGSIADQSWPEGQLFYIQDGRQVVGNCVLFWRVEGQGYTCDLKEAWRVPYDKALSLENNRSTEILWPCEELDRISKVHVDIQYLRRLQAGPAPETYYPNLADGL